MRIAVIIPTRNEAETIRRTIRAVREGGEAALIVVADCGSDDGTPKLAAAEGAIVTGGPELTSRADALNAGAACALARSDGLDVLWFLHADTIPPTGWDRAIAHALRDPSSVGGAFRFRWDLAGVPFAQRAVLRFYTLINRARYRLSRRYFGDQAIFVRPEALHRIGGVPDRTLMEDIALCRRLQRIGRLHLAQSSVVTSPRRFVHHGVIRQAAIDLIILASEPFGARATRLHAWYNREKG